MAKKLFKCWQQKLQLTLLLTFLINVSVFAQEKYTLTGVVMLEALAQPASGVSVIIKGTDTGTVTDFDGNYIIEVANGDILEFIYLGFKTQSLIVTGQLTADISLKDDIDKLEEIVVVGYGTQKKKNVTGSVSKVSGKKLTQSSVSRVDDALVGRVSGVQIAAANSEAGGDTKITVRGVGSITGNSAPLIVVDGIPLGNDADILGTIDSNTIKSVDILKDASSTAIYGSRGANGVILVTLKEGTEGKTTYSYNTYFGVKWAEKNEFVDFGLDEFESHLNGIESDLDLNDPLDFVISEKLKRGQFFLEAGREVADVFGGETDYQDLIIPGGTITSHSFAASGGNKRVKYNTSLSYLHDEGLLLEDDFKKYNGRVKVDVTSKNKKFRMGASIAGTRTIQKRPGESLRNKFRQPSYLGPYVTQELLDSGFINPDEDANNVFFNQGFEVGDYTFLNFFNNVFNVGEEGGLQRDANGELVLFEDGGGNPEDISITNNANPLAEALEQDRFKIQNSFRFSGYGELKLKKGLKLRQNLFGDTRVTTNTRYRGLEHDSNLFENTVREIDVNTRDHFGSETLLTYKRDIKKHTVNAVAGTAYEFWEYGRTDVEAGGFTTDATQNIALGDDSLVETLLGEETLVSAFARFNYDYDDKYIISLNARTDGSSRFAKGNQYGFFPAASIGWRISNENFLKNSSFITDLKLRTSYGISGSNDINSNVYLSLYRSQQTFSTVSYNGESGIKETVLADNDLTWESLIEFNPGIDLEFGNGALGLSLDYFERTSKDLLLDQSVGTAIGVPTALSNIGEVVNTGYEVEVRSRLVNSSNFQWNVSAIVSTNENEVTDFGGNDQLITALNDEDRPAEFITQVGGPISAFYGFVYDSEPSLAYVNLPFDRYNLVSEEVYVKDLNGDGVIDDDDRTVLGDPYPDITWSLTNDFQIHDFDLSFLVQGSHGAQVRALGLQDLRNEISGSDSQVVDIDPDLLSDDTFDGAVPNEQALRSRFLTSDHIQDADFISLRNVNIGYTLPSSAIEKFNFSKLRIYVTAENLVYVTDDGYFGFNPEDLSYTSGNANDPITQGVQRVANPIAKTVSIGLNLDF